MKKTQIEVIGCPGSGKTTLCSTLKEFGWNPILEPYEQNPFLHRNYKDKNCAFELQTCFLLQHFYDLKNSLSKKVICDFSLELDYIYASILLKAEEMTIYNNLFDYIIHSVKQPDLIIKLMCPNEIIIERIKKRNREFESNIDIDFIKELNTRVNHYTPQVKYIEIDSSNINLLDKKSVLENIINIL